MPELFSKEKRSTGWLLFLGISLLFFLFWALTVGPAGISFSDTAAILWGGLLTSLSRITFLPSGLSIWLAEKGAVVANTFPDSYAAIIFDVRMPRVILGGLVGMSLSVTGGCFQGLFKNPMADPYIIGVSSGASVGAALAIVLGLRLLFFGANWAVVFLAFFGALVTVSVVYRIACIDGRIPVSYLLLAGVAVASFLTAVVSFLILMSRDAAHGTLFWIMGSLAGSSWPLVIMMLPFTFLGIFVIVTHARSLNAILLGEESAQHLGVDVERVKRVLFAAGSLLIAAAVSVSGAIGFVGLIIPHMVRLVVGPDHKILLPAAGIVGGLFLIICDALARIVMAPAEIPVGIITAAAGAPFFIYLLRKRKRDLFY
ncbi:MAG: FecCD family ABC transporter permease [Bacillota bacterium]|jgi:iron complex transport system permease protein